MKKKLKYKQGGTVSPPIPIGKRPSYMNPDGSYSNEVSMGFSDQNGSWSIPTFYDGKVHSSNKAVDRFYRTGEHFGKFANDADNEKSSIERERINQTIPIKENGYPTPRRTVEQNSVDKYSSYFEKGGIVKRRLKYAKGGTVGGDPKKPSTQLKIPQSGVVVDKRTNTAYYYNEKGEKGSFPVLTGGNVEGNEATNSLDEMHANPNIGGVTPRGGYLLDVPDTKKGFGTKYLNKIQKNYRGNLRTIAPIETEGASKPVVENIRLGFHGVYSKTGKPNDSEFIKRTKLLNGSDAEARATSKGCVNCKDDDYKRIEQAFPKSDTLMIIDSKIPEDNNLLQEVQKRTYTKTPTKPTVSATPILSKVIDQNRNTITNLNTTEKRQEISILANRFMSKTPTERINIMKNIFKKKYLSGVQAIETPQADFPQSGDFLKQGIAQGMASGSPIGAGIGLLSGGVSEIVNQATIPKRQKLLRQRQLNASTQNATLGVNRGMDVNAAYQYSNLDEGTEFIAEDGLVAPHQSLIEVEKNELVFRKFGHKTKLVADFQKGKLHNEGGEDFVAEEGDIIIPKTKRKLVFGMVDKSSGFITDKTRFDKIVNKLPKDKDKAMLGTVVGAGMQLGGSLLSGISQAADTGEGRSHRIAKQVAPIGDVLQVGGGIVQGIDGMVQQQQIDKLAEQQAMEQNTPKFKYGGEVKNPKPVNQDKTPTKGTLLLDDGTSIGINMNKRVNVKKSSIGKSSPLKFSRGGLVGKDGQLIPSTVPTTDDQLVAGEQQYANFNNPAFSDNVELAGPRSVYQTFGNNQPLPNFDNARDYSRDRHQDSNPNPNYFADKSMINSVQTPNTYIKPMSQDLPRKFGQSPKVNTTPSLPTEDGPVVGRFRLDANRNNAYPGLAASAGTNDAPVNSLPPLKDSSLGVTQLVTKVDSTLPTDSKKKKFKFNSGTAVDGAFNLASSLITDENSNPEIRNSNLLTAQHLTAVDTGDPNRQAALINKEGAKRFRRNAAGGNINQVVAGMSADDQNYLGQLNQINAGQADKFQSVQNQNVQMDNTVNQYNTERRNADIDINDANRARARDIKRSSKSNYADAVQQTKFDKDVNQRDANLEAENIRANAAKAGVDAAKHEEVMKAIEQKRQYDQGYLKILGASNPQADANLKRYLISNFGLTEDQAKVYLGNDELSGRPNLSGAGLSTTQKRKLTYGR